MELTAGLTNVVAPGALTSLVLRLLTLVQVGPQSAQPLGVAGRGAVARAGLAAGAAHQARPGHSHTCLMWPGEAVHGGHVELRHGPDLGPRH